MMIKKKYIFFFAFFFVICGSMVITGYCDNVTLYASIDDSNSQANLLTDLMRNDSNYDPFNEYAIVRAGERDYRVYFGKDLSKNNLTMIQFIPAYQYNNAQVNRAENKSLSITENGFYYIGVKPGTAASKLADDYKLGAVVGVAAVVLVFLFIFRIFRKSEHKRMKFYNVR